MSKQDSFEFCGRDLEAFVFDQLFRAIDDEKMRVVVPVTNIASMQPAIGINGMRGCFGTVQISLHNLWTTDADFAFLIWSESLAAFKTNDLAFCIGSADSDRAEFYLQRIRRRGVCHR